MSQSTDGLPFSDTVVFYVLETIAFASGFEAVVSLHAGESWRIYLSLLLGCIGCAVLGFATKSGWFRRPPALSKARWIFYVVALGIPVAGKVLFPEHNIRIAIQLLPCCRDINNPPLTAASGAALTIQNMTDTPQRDSSVMLKFPIIRRVRLDDPERIKRIGGVGPDGGGTFIHLAVPVLERQEVRSVLIDFVSPTEFKSTKEWAKRYGYSPDVAVFPPGMLTIQ